MVAIPIIVTGLGIFLLIDRNPGSDPEEYGGELIMAIICFVFGAIVSMIMTMLLHKNIRNRMLELRAEDILKPMQYIPLSTSV